MKKVLRLRNLVWFVIPALFWWALRDIPIAEVWNSFDSFTLTGIAVLILLNGAIILVMTSRWWIVLRVYGYKLPVLPMVAYRLSSFSVSYFTPGTQFGGEPLQVHFPHNRHQVPTAIALAAVAVDRIFDLFTNIVFVAFGLLVFLGYGLTFDFVASPLSYGLVCLMVLPLFYMFTVWAGWSPFTKLLALAAQLIPNSEFLRKTTNLSKTTENSLTELLKRKPSIILWMATFSGLIWLLMISEYWLSLLFLGASLDISQVLFALTAARVAFLVPVPGGAGALEASQVWAMEVLGMEPATGAALVLLIRLRDVSLGLIGLWFAARFINQPSKMVPTPQAINLTR